jgi:flavin-dependent dehydrogenase
MMPPISKGNQIEALIIGGGPAGAATAALLARRGREVEIIEQSAAMHHKVCGEFLSSEAVSYLAQLGLDLDALGAVPIHSVRLARRTCIAECELPFTAMSITRRRLDEALLTLAQREGAIVRRGRRIESLRRSPPGWAAQFTGGEVRHAQSVFLATGKHDLGGHRRPPGKQNNLIAFKMYFQVAPAQKRALRGWVELTLFPGGYAGMQLTEEGDANLCLLVNHATLGNCRNDWQKLLERILHFSEHLAQRLEGAEPLLPKPLALSSIPYGMLVRQAEPGLWRLGDQAGVMPSFSGDGISVALHSALVAASLYASGGTSDQLAERLHKELSGSIRLAITVSRLMIAAPGLAPLLRLYPSLLTVLATHTRVPQNALIA